ncbi:FxSxx-COOH system tetratricopeptide repeat protein [Nonomuraea lactucae]|uniref:FxSxx-COOH system tetratricopeptide repeat protein n=1 Tax=Nonomuraea lactucae TaxID=2249762 RepID=UPI000DE1A940|nr:FxSxx-COOH system tetratricopeptide repeat protein [Nonomuraea lactucae]
MNGSAVPPQRGRGADPQGDLLADLVWLASRVAVYDPPTAEPPSAPPPDRVSEQVMPPRAPQQSPPRTAPDPPLEGAGAPEHIHQAGPWVGLGVGGSPETGSAVPAAERPRIGRRAITRALRPLRATVPSPHHSPLLDEEGTAERAARDGLWLPVVNLSRERLLDVDIVIDESRTALLHQEKSERFVAALADLGAFRAQRVHLLDTDVAAGGEPLLRARAPRSVLGPASGLALPERTGRRLIIVLTDGIGDAWHHQAAQRLLARWGQGSAVCVVHLMPSSLWRRTGIEASRAVLRNTVRAGPNADYRAAGRPVGGVEIPLLDIWPARLRSWAEFAMGARERWQGPAMTCSTTQQADDLPDLEDELSAEEWVQRFRTDVTPTAFQLAVHLAAAPLSLPVMRLVQRRLLPSSTDAHLAELLGSGLVRLTGQRGDGLPVAGGVPYDFRPGVRQELLMAGRRSETARVLMTVVDHLGEDVRELRQLRDVITSPGSARLPVLPASLSPLVEPTLAGLESMAGPYSKPARLLKDALHSAAPPRKTGRKGDPLPGEGVYQHVVKEFPDPDYFGVTVNMSTQQVAQPRQPHEPTPVWNIPQRNQAFTGREDLLALLHEKLQSGTTAVLPEALHGLGGVGKSQIAIEYCYRHQEDYDLVWWVPSERLPVVRQAYVDLAAHLNLDVNEPSVTVPAVKEALRIGRPYRKWLLVFDNAEDVEEIQRFFPTNGPGKIIITSRSREWFQHANRLEVDVFRREESRELLRRRGPQLTDREADEIAERLGDLPLAIEQAAVLLAETGMPISEYLRLFDSKRDELLRVEGSAVPVAVAWNISFERLRQTDPAALQLLQVCAHLAPDPIPWSLLASSRDLEGPAELVEALRDPITISRMIRAIGQYSLCKVNHRDNSLSLHRLVQRVVTGQLSPQETALTRHCGHLLLANSDPRKPRDRTRWPEYQMLLPHVLASDLEECDDSWARNLYLNLMDYLFLWGDIHGYRAMARRAVETWAAALGPDHDATLAAELRLSRALNRFADFKGAYELQLHVRDTLRDRLGPDHERTLEAEGFLSIGLRFLGRFKEALEVDKRAYETLHRRFGPDDPLTLEQAHLLCIDWRLNGEPARAKEIDVETYRRKEEVLGPDSISTQSSRAALVIDEMECGNYREALRLQERHHNVMVSRYGKSHPGAMDSIALLSVMHRKAGNHDDALKLSEEALALFTARYGEKYQSTVATSLNHAVNLRHMGDLSQSVEIGQKAKVLYEEIFGSGHPNAPTAAVNVAVSLRLMKRLDEACEMDQESFAAFIEMLGPDHPRTLVCSVNLASDLFELEQYENALERDRDTLQRLRRVHGKDHPTTLACAHNLSLDLRALGREEEADTMFKETLERYRRVLGEEHPAVEAALKGRRANCDIYPIPL